MYIEVKGRQVFAATGGRPPDYNLPVVIFLHGSALDHSFWGLYTRFFAFQNYAVLAPDLPGHTFSDGPFLLSIEEMADWLNDVIDALGIDDISLVAHSQGCLIALEFASRYPDKLRSVSFIASGLATPVIPDLIDAAENKPETAIAMMNSWSFGPASHLLHGPIPGNSMMAGRSKVMSSSGPNELTADLRACDAYANGANAAAGIKAPAQVIIGGSDRMAAREATMALVDALPGAETTVLENSSHMVPLEAPDTCRKLLWDFIFKHTPVA